MSLRHGTPRWTVAFVLAILVSLGTGGTVRADPAGPTDYLSEILSVEPSTSSVSFEVIGGDSFIQMTTDSGTDAMVVGYCGEPYLWFLPDGTVRENSVAPTTAQNEERYGNDDAAACTAESADVPPDWDDVASDGTFAWHDHRAHWMQPIRPAGAEPGDQILEQVIPVTVDGDEIAVTVISTWQPEPSMVPAILGAVFGALVAAGAFVVSRRSSGWAVALVPVALAATVAGWWQYSSLPPETDPRLVWPLLPTLATLAAVAAPLLARRSAFAATAAGLVASAELLVWAFVKRDGLTAAIVPTDAPQSFERFVLVLAFVAAIGGLTIAIERLFFATPGTRTAVATT
jgi:hypothetical protein